MSQLPWVLTTMLEGEQVATMLEGEQGKITHFTDEKTEAQRG